MQVVSRARSIRGIIFALIGGIGWGLSGTSAEYLMESHAIDPVWLTAMRMSVSSVIFILIALLFDRARFLKAVTDKKSLTGFFIFGIFGVAFCQVTYHYAISYTNSGTATVLEMLGLALVMFYSCRLSHRLPRKRELTGLALALVGVFLVATHADITSLAIPPAGLFWGLVSAFGLAFYNLIPTRLIGKWGSIITIGMAMLFGGALMCLFERPWLAFDTVTIDGGFLLGFAGVTLIGTVLSASLYMQAISDIGPVKASLLAAIEPVAATIFSATFLDTHFAPIDIVGFACIVIMIILVSSPSKKGEDDED